MPELNVSDAGEAGLVSDLPYSETPPNAWTSVRNARMFRSRVLAFPGHAEATKNANLQQLNLLQGVTSPTSHFWLNMGPAQVSGDLKLYAFDGTTHTDITPAAGLPGDLFDVVIGDGLNQNAVLTNGIGPPVFWPLLLGAKADTLPGWDPNWRAAAVRAFKGFLIAMDMTETGERFPFRVRWSDAAPPGGLPTSWDALDPTVLAGAQDLGDTTGFLLNGLPLRDAFVIYTENETIAMRLVGGELTWSFRIISRLSGLIAPRAVVTFRGRHLAVTEQDVVLIDGQSVESVIDRRARDYLFRNINQDRYRQTFAFLHPTFNEVWVCFPGQGVDYCSEALTWNWRTGAWGQRDLPENCLAAGSAIDIVGLQTFTWNTLPFRWDNWNRTWNQRAYDSTESVVLLGGGEADGAPIYRAEVGSLFAGNTRLSRVEKLGIRLADEQVVTVHELWPRATGAPFTVRIGTQMEPNGPVSWKVTRSFDPETDRKVTCRASGRYLCVAFESQSDAAWELHGFLVKYRPGARR